MNKEFWAGKRVLITGHTGFKGAWLSLWLQKVGANVVGYALAPPTSPSLFEAAKVAEGMQSVEADIRDLERIEQVIQRFKPGLLIHMAAQSLVRRSYSDPVGTYGVNVIGTVNVLEAIRRSDCVRVFVNVTSDKCYENKEWFWGYRENEPMGGHDPYSSSKGCSELVTAAYRNSFFSETSIDHRVVAIASARAGNVIGGGDWGEDRLIPDIVKAFMRGDPVLIRRPEAVRPWQHVLEPLRGYLYLMQRMWEHGVAFSQAWNFGPNDHDARPVAWIVDRLVRLWGKGASSELDTALHPHEAKALYLDCSKAKTLLGWSPVLDLPTTLEWLVTWYRAYQEKRDMRDFSENEITKYESRVTQADSKQLAAKPSEVANNATRAT